MSIGRRRVGRAVLALTVALHVAGFPCRGSHAQLRETDAESAFFEDMPALGTGSLSLAMGNFHEAYLIVDRAGITVLRDPYTNKPFVQFYTTRRVGGDVVQFEALKFIRFGT